MKSLRPPLSRQGDPRPRVAEGAGRDTRGDVRDAPRARARVCRALQPRLARARRPAPALVCARH